MNKFTISKKLSIWLNVGVVIWLLVAVGIGVQPFGLILMSLASSSWYGLLFNALILLAPPSIILMNMVYEGKRLSTVNTILQGLFLLMYWAIGVLLLFVPMALHLAFWAATALYALILLKAIARAVRNFIKTSRKKKIIAASVFVLVVAVVATPFIIFEIQSRQRLAQVTNALNESAEKLKALNAVEHFDGSRLPAFRKEGIIDRADCNYVHPCPTGVREWFVLMDNTSRHRREESVRAIFTSLGYEVGRYSDSGFWTEAQRLSDHSRLRISVNSIDNLQPPYPAPQGKVWRFLMVNAELSNYIGMYREESEPLKTYSSANQELSFDYPETWIVEEKDNVIFIKSPNGQPGVQPSGEPKAVTGEVIKIVITPCAGGRECTLDGVFDGVYKYSSWPPGYSADLDDGTNSTSFIFQYRGEDATSYRIFFREGKKYIVSFNAAGSESPALSLNDSSSKVFYPLVRNMRFYK